MTKFPANLDSEQLLALLKEATKTSSAAENGGCILSKAVIALETGAGGLVHYHAAIFLSKETGYKRSAQRLRKENVFTHWLPLPFAKASSYLIRPGKAKIVAPDASLFGVDMQALESLWAEAGNNAQPQKVTRAEVINNFQIVNIYSPTSESPRSSR